MSVLHEDLVSATRPADDSTQENARQEVRHRVHWRAQISLNSTLRIEARVVDISTRGIGLSCDVPFAAGSQILVIAAAPRPKDLTRSVMIQLPCVVQYHALSGAGFRIGALLRQLDDVNRLLLEQLVQQRAMR